MGSSRSCCCVCEDGPCRVIGDLGALQLSRAHLQGQEGSGEVMAGRKLSCFAPHQSVRMTSARFQLFHNIAVVLGLCIIRSRFCAITCSSTAEQRGLVVGEHCVRPETCCEGVQHKATSWRSSKRTGVSVSAQQSGRQDISATR